MLTPDEIKKLIEIAKPEGYTFETVVYQTTICLWRDVYYPLFLQKCIEGINRHNIGYYIIQRQDSVEACCDDGNWSDFLINGYGLTSIYNVDQAKEEALRYILEEIDGL